MKTLMVEVIDSRGIEQPACYSGQFINVANPPTLVLTGPAPTPATFVVPFSQCGMWLEEMANDPWGGKWSISGTATYKGQAKPFSGSGTVPAGP